MTPRERELIQQRGEPPGARVSRRLGRGHIDGSGEVDVDLRPMPSRRLTAHRGEQLAERAAAPSDGHDGKLPGVRGTADERTGGHAGATSDERAPARDRQLDVARPQRAPLPAGGDPQVWSEDPLERTCVGRGGTARRRHRGVGGRGVAPEGAGATEAESSRGTVDRRVVLGRRKTEHAKAAPLCVGDVS